MAVALRGPGPSRVAHNGREAVSKFRRCRTRCARPGHHASRRRWSARSCSGSANQGPIRPPLFLTARDSVMDRVTGLTAGRRRLHDQAVSAWRSWSPACAACYDVSSHLAPPAEDRTDGRRSHARRRKPRKLTRAGTPISLSSTEFELLRFLMRNPRRALTRTEILDPRLELRLSPDAPALSICTSRICGKKIDAGERSDDSQPCAVCRIHAPRAGLTPRWQRNDQGRKPLGGWRPRTLRHQLVLGVSAVVHSCPPGGRRHLRGEFAELRQRDERCGKSLIRLMHWTIRLPGTASANPDGTADIGQALLGFTEQNTGNVIAVIHDGRT